MWFSNLFGWQKTMAAIDQLEKELTPAMKASVPLVAKPIVVIDTPGLAPCPVPGCRHFSGSLFCHLHTAMIPAWCVEQWNVIQDSDLSAAEKRDNKTDVFLGAMREIGDQQAACSRESLQPIVSRRPQTVR